MNSLLMRDKEGYTEETLPGIHREGGYLHPSQDEAEQPPQPEPDDEDDESLEPLPIPNLESRFSASGDPHFGQTTSGYWPKTSFSKSCRHLMHWYS